ncbi:hypothetical protein [Streptomyces hainanensis]|uniref:Uncharacterized protein n=1 Tax=Streptomyces hainanensis TaxID=402648 RepID=A0A4R4TQ65_9ACTN|nr:hypothetical protein [Streptomyces hainanensis]TDC80100.1 hypothetical protein E1283_01125 [Streptomyces hainanensis]
MSTTHTGADDGRRRIPRPGRRAAAAAAPRNAPRPRRRNRSGHEEELRQARSALLARCRRAGRRAARRGVFDAWVLEGEGLPSWLAALAAERDELRHRLDSEAAVERSAAVRSAAQAQAEADAAEAALRHSGEARAERSDHLDITRAQLDRLAEQAARRRQLRDTVAHWVERRPGGAAQAAPDADPLPEPAARPAADPARWEGASATGISRRGTLALLCCLTLVELPIYWTSFQRVHGTGDPSANLLTATFTVAVGIVMVSVPHVLGRLLRTLPATGAPRLLALPALVLLGAWVHACWVLGGLRASLLAEDRALLTNPDQARYLDPGMADAGSVLDQIGMGEQTMSLMFTALLLLSGGVAFLLGLAVAHPYLAAYRATSRERERLMAAERESTLAARRAGQRAAAHPAEAQAYDDALKAAQSEVDERYEAAAHAYLDGVAAAARDPAVTEAAMRLSGQWPLLPRSTGT